MSATEHDLDRMRRAVALARKGRFAVEPNPPVGAIIEGPGGIVGEGWHEAYGGPHAEAVALALAGPKARGATAYVTLEPCAHHGKTPPCADALIDGGVARVVYGADDPNPLVAGRGVARLRNAGIEVVGPTLRDEARGLLNRFESSLQRARPWVVSKWAMSLDGGIAAAEGRPSKVSGRRANLLTHGLRGHADAVAIGIHTALVDDPVLTCRLEGGVPHGRPQPTRVVFDTDLRLPLDGRLVAGVDAAPVLVFGATDAPADRRAGLEAAGCAVELIARAPGGVDLAAALDIMGSNGMRRVLVEGGAHIHGALFRDGLVDHVHAYVAPLLLGGGAVRAGAGVGLDGLRLEDVMWRKLGDDLLIQGYVPR